jgi:hypothetical protein
LIIWKLVPGHLVSLNPGSREGIKLLNPKVGPPPAAGYRAGKQKLTTALDPAAKAVLGLDAMIRTMLVGTSKMLSGYVPKTRKDPERDCKIRETDYESGSSGTGVNALTAADALPAEAGVWPSCRW